MKKTRIGIVGASGRMGRMLIEATLKDEAAQLAAVFDQPGSPALGRDAAELAGMPASGVLVSADLPAGLADCDCLIDFTRPEGTLRHLELCEQAGVAMEELDFLLGRTLAATAVMYGVAVRMTANGPELVVLPA